MSSNRKNSTLETMVMHQLAEDRAKKSSKSMQSAKDAGVAEPTSTELGNAFDEVCAMALFPKMGVKNVIFPDGANDKGIDFYRIFEDGSITIAQCKYDEKFDLRHVQCEADKTRDFINDVCNGYVASEDFDPHEKPLNMPDKLDLLFDAICKICACEGRSAVFDKITYYCFMSVSQTGDREETVNKIKAEKGFGQVRIYAGQDIVKLNDDNLLDVEGVPNLDIGITASELASARAAAARKLGYINAMTKERAKESSEAGSDAEFTPLDMFQVMLLNKDLISAVSREFEDGYGYTRLLCNNVRNFIDNTNLCEAMKQTLAEEPQNFAAYNNGLSIVCSGIQHAAGSDEDCDPHIILQNAAIVNGGQTTATLAATNIKNGADLSGIYVQMKLTILRSDDPELIRNIAKYANSQNKVKTADLNSSHPFYVRMEDFSRKVYAPIFSGQLVQQLWFFERARGQYEQPLMQMTKKQRDDYKLVRPKDKKFTLTDLAKYLNAADMLPHYVSWGGEVNAAHFHNNMEEQWDTDNSVYNELYYKELIGKKILFAYVESTVSAQEWYQENRAYRPQLVAYTISKLVFEAKKQNKFINFREFWDYQKVSDVYYSDIAAIAKIVFDTIYDPNRSTTNIETYCKKEECWKIVQDKPYRLSDELVSIMITKSDKSDEISEAKKEQKIINSISDEISIFKKGADYWQSMIDRGVDQKVIGYAERQTLEKAISYCTGKIMQLSKTQIKDIVKTVDLLRENGIE